MSKSLEELLLLASDEVEYRDAFYEKLLESEVFVLGGEDAQEGEDIQEQETISLMEWESEDGLHAVPFFSSYDLLEEAVGADQLYIKIQTAVLFATVPEMNLVINPGFDASKLFTPEEVAMLLSYRFDEEEDGESAEYSEELSLHPLSSNRSVKMLKALKKFFVKHRQVKLAYVAEMGKKDENDTLQLAMGIEIEGDAGDIFSQISDIVLELAENESVDLFEIDRKAKEGMSAYFLHEMKPFYIRK
jgi:hypothetical protein